MQADDILPIGIEAPVVATDIDFEDDPIIDEYDVYLGRPQESEPYEPYLFQFPLRPSSRPYGDQGYLAETLISNYRTVKATGEVSYGAPRQFLQTYELNRESECYDRSKRSRADELLTKKKTEEGGLSAEEEVELNQLTKAHLVSSLIKDASDTTLGYFKNGNLYMLPLMGCLHFKAHVDGAVINTEGMSSYERVRSYVDELSPEAADYRDLVTTFVNKKRLAVAANDSGYADSAYGGSGADGVSTALLNSTAYTIRLQENPIEYIRSLCADQVGPGQRTAPLITESAVGEEKFGSLSYLSLAKLPPAKQVERILKVRGVVSNQDLASLMATPLASHDLFSVTSKQAWLVQGVWVCKSQVLYNQVSGRNRESLETIRDLCVVFLMRGQPVNPPAVQKYAAKFPLDEIMTIVRGLCVFTQGKWTLKVDPDLDFANEYKDTAQIANDFYLNSLRELATRAATASIDSSSTVAADGKVHLDEVIVPFVANAALQALLSTILKQGIQTLVELAPKFKREALLMLEAKKKDELDAIRSSGVSVTASLDGAVQQRFESSRKALEALSNDTVEVLLHTVAVPIKNLWVIREPQNEFKIALLNLLQTDPDAHYTKAQIVDHAQSFMRKPLTITDIKFRNVLGELCINERGLWIFRGADRSSVGDESK